MPSKGKIDLLLDSGCRVNEQQFTVGNFRFKNFYGESNIIGRFKNEFLHGMKNSTCGLVELIFLTGFINNEKIEIEDSRSVDSDIFQIRQTPLRAKIFSHF